MLNVLSFYYACRDKENKTEKNVSFHFIKFPLRYTLFYFFIADFDYLKRRINSTQRPRLCEGLELEFRPPGGNADKK